MMAEIPYALQEATQLEKRKAEELTVDDAVVAIPEKRIKKLDERTLELVLDTSDEIWRLTSFFEPLWKLFADSYQADWISIVTTGNPALRVRRCMKISYRSSEEKSLDSLRKAVYRFLQALLFKPPRNDRSELEKEQDERNSRKIQIPFVKLICYVAWKTHSDLEQPVVFERPFAVAFFEDRQEFHPACLVCPKPKRVEGTKHLYDTLKKTQAHYYDLHLRSDELGRQFVDKRNVDSELKITLDEYLIKLQQNIASFDATIKLLGLKHEDHWFKKQ